ncbi:MAG: cupredoxin domain-containing protein [Patescibacteria group bacterium]
MNKRYLIPIIFITIVVGIFYFLKLSNSSLEFKSLAITVELKEEGFYPSEIAILKGQTVTFKTNRGKTFWPASDLHPSHTIYPEFDSKEPIESEQSWTFKFNKIGEWKYHDHLAPYYKGAIKVIDKV